jgi:hypothetical protein
MLTGSVYYTSYYEIKFIGQTKGTSVGWMGGCILLDTAPVTTVPRIRVLHLKFLHRHRLSWLKSSARPGKRGRVVWNKPTQLSFIPLPNHPTVDAMWSENVKSL